MKPQLRAKGVSKVSAFVTSPSIGFIITSLLPLLLLLLLNLAPPAEAAVNCTDAGSACINGVCNGTTGNCLCPANGYLTFADARCDNISTISVSQTAANLTQSNTSFIQSARVSFTGTIFQGGFPIGEGVLATSLFVCSNGYVTMNSNFCTCRVDLLTNASFTAAVAVPPFVAPLATSLDYRSSAGTSLKNASSSSLVSYQLVASVDSEASLRAMRDNISELAGTTAAIVVTWSRMSPATMDLSTAVQWMTTQLILFTDRRKTTVAAMLYSENTLKHYFDWLPTVVGWKAGGGGVVPVTLAASRSSALTYANQAVSVGGSGVKARLRLITLYRNVTAPVNDRALCLDESLSPLSVSVAVSACPQTWQQARSDPRYIKDAEVPPTAGRRTASLLAPNGVENATQLTCFYHNATGGLLVQESTVKIVSKNVSLGAGLYDKCCVRAPDLCQLYYSKFPQPSSAGYARPTLAGFVTGAGLFKTFDNLQYKYMDAGDFWLVDSATLKVQIRMETINVAANNTVNLGANNTANLAANDTVNLAANNTAVVTAAVVQFTGLTNFTIEVHWNRSAGRLESWYYTVNESPLTNVTALSTTQTAVTSNAVATGSNTKLVCYTMNSATWVEILSDSHGLTVTAYIDKPQLGVIAGPLGNGNGNSTDVVAYRNGSALGEPQLSVQAAINEALLTWSVNANDSLFRVSPIPPVREAGWVGALYWNAAWDTNHTALCEALFQGNATVCNASMTTDACGGKPSNTTAYRHCVLEFADCQPSAGAACSAAYLALLDTTVPTVLADLACSPPQWNSTTTGQPVSLVDGVAFSLTLSTLTAAGTPSNVTFSKVAGPSGLTVLPNGSLTWLPNQTEIVAPILIGLANSAREACVSLWPVRIRLIRRAGLCPGNATEGFGFQAATTTATAVTQQNQVTVSSCVCNANRYGTDCSFATCQLDCCHCDTTTPTNCSASCPVNYDKSLAGSLTVCAYTDRCDLSACLGSNYTGCISVDPALQTDTYKYQCSCTKGYQYPLANPNDKTRCEDIDECQYAALCDTSKNRTCQNSPGSFNCSCSPGYDSAASGGANCLDIDECLASNGTVCQNANCSNTPGSYRCNCNAGYYQDTAQRCTDINECASPASVNCTHQCVNTNGSFNCNCFSGFSHPTDDAISCQAQNKCAASNTCTYKDLCANISGTDVCYCAASQTLTGSTCSPRTFCTAEICGPNANCTETNPGFACSCAQHYELNGDRVCVKSQYCTNPAKYPSVCPSSGPFVCSVDPTTNAPTCRCTTGYALLPSSGRVCADIDECANATTNACHAGSTNCRNTVGSYVCKCRIGYSRLNATHCAPAPYVYQIAYTYADQVYTAELADPSTEAFKRMADLLEQRIEAALPPDGTGSPSARIFAMSAGSVVATTVATYGTATSADAIRASASSAGVTAAVSAAGFNECNTAIVPAPNDCSVEHNCVNKAAGYQCQCKIGYTQTGTRASFPANTVIADCVDVDECLSECRNTTASGGNRTCVNTPGSYICSCANGTYSPDPKTSPCQDPCVSGRCLNGGVCQYQVSDQFPYKCICTAGYVGFNCELTDSHYTTMQRNAIIIGVVLGVALLIALVIVIVCIVLKTRQRQAKPSSRDDASSTARLHTRDAATAAAVLEAPPPAPRPSEGNYRGRQQQPAVAMVETTIPRVQQSAKHPSSFENRSFENGASGNRRPRSDYF